jgi:predicted DNA-binding antitoxin AbrB/MazE fold protein
MVHNVDAIYGHGVLRPIDPLPLLDGARVHLRVEVNGGLAQTGDYIAWLDNIAGRWQGEFHLGGERDFDTRQAIS